MSSLVGANSTPSVSRVGNTGYNQINIPADPRIQQLWSQLYNSSQGGLQGGLGHLSRLASGDQSSFAQLEAPALRQFGELQGQIASRFSGMGLGGRRSSGFQNSMGSAAADLAERLQSQRLALQNQAIKDLMGMSQTLLGTPLSDNVFMPKPKPFWQELLGGFAPGIGQGLGQLGYLGGARAFGLLG